MAEKIIGWAAWHPVKGFDKFAYEGPVVFADLDRDVLEQVNDLNDSDGTDKTNGWRVVKVECTRITDG